MQRRIRIVSAAAAILSVAVFLTACGNNKKDDAKAGTTSSTTAATATSSSAPIAAAAVKLMAAKDAKLGDVVTDAAGFTLYRFDKDSAKPPTATCAGECATSWPPVLATDKPDVEGVTGTVATVMRADGGEQVTINGWPVYRFGGDSAPGQTNGQGVGKVWYAVTPAGGKAGAAGSGPASSPSAYSKAGY